MKLHIKGKLYTCDRPPILLNFRLFVVHFFNVSISICFKETIINSQVAFQMLYLLYIFSMQMGNTVLLTETYTAWGRQSPVRGWQHKTTWYIEIVQGSPQTDQ